MRRWNEVTRVDDFEENVAKPSIGRGQGVVHAPGGSNG
jgi:hypothetical protein